MSGSFLRGLLIGAAGAVIADGPDSDIDGDLDGIEIEDGDIVIDSEELYSIAENNIEHLEQIHAGWQSMSAQEQQNTDPENYAKDWIKTNLKNVSENTLVILISIFGGIILGNMTASSYISSLRS